MMMSSSSSLTVPQSHRRRRRQDKEETHPDDTNNNNNNDGTTKAEKRRQRALEEAQAVLESPFYDEERLENFNLLGVVTNPRSAIGGLPPAAAAAAATAMSSPHGRVTNPHGDAAATATASLSWGDTWQSSLEVATHSIDSLNVWMDHVSKAYLGTSDESELEYYLDQIERNEDGSSSSLLPIDMDLPPPIQALVSDLPHVLDDYLQINRPLAHSFDQRQQQQLEQPQHELSPTTIQEPNNGSNHNQEEEAGLLEDDEYLSVLDDVPELFFRSDFDLTHAETFERLLVLSHHDDSNHNEELFETVDVSSEFEVQQRPLVSDALRNPTSDIVRVHDPESLTGHLDAVELSLLGQVRSKSERFFKETDRFSQLKTLIDESLGKVHDLRGVLGNVSRVTSVDVTRIPTMDVQRSHLAQLNQLLDRIQQVVDSKSTIGPLMSTGDFLGVTQAIHRTRTLFQPQSRDTNHNDCIDLSKLKCLSKTQDQLNQYQQLAVSNLSNQLVDLFLHWGSISGGGSNNNSNSNAMADFFPMDHASPYNASSSSAASSTGGSSIVTFAQRQKVRDICRALELCGTLSETGQTYSDRLQAVIRVTVRTTISECAHDAASSIHVGGALSTNAVESSPMSPAAANNNNSGTPNNNKASSILTGVTSMTFEQFMNCLEMLFEQISVLRNTAVSVHKFCKEEGITLRDKDDSETSATAAADALAVNGGLTSPASSSSTMATAAALVTAAELIERSVSELLRMRKEAHSLVTFEEMRHLWDTCLSFTLSLERASGGKAYGLRSTLLAQAKAFVERKHESNMANLAAALDSERWTQCDVSTERQASLIRLCSGRAVLSYTFGGDTPSSTTTANNATTSSTTVNGTPKKDGKKLADAEVEGIRYKVVWSCLLLVEMVMSNVACAAHFQTLATNVVGKVSELLRLFNSRATTLVLGAGAIHSAARLKSINAKHLALVTQCLGLFISILPHVRAALMAQLPSKQHTLLGDLDKIKKEYNEHNEKVLAKFVSIIGGVVEHVLAPRIAKTDFDARANVSSQTCCPFLEGIATNTRKMHQVLNALLPPEHLQDVFSRIFAYVDSKVPALFFAAAASAEVSSGDTNSSPPSFQLPETDEGKRRMVLEVEIMTKALNGLKHVRPWEFGAMGVVSRKLDIVVYSPPPPPEQEEVEDSVNDDDDDKNESTNEDAPPLPEMKKVEENVDNEEGNDHESVNETTQNDDAPTLPGTEKVEETGVAESNVEDSVIKTTGTDDDPPLSETEKVEESGDDEEAIDEDSASTNDDTKTDDAPTLPETEKVEESGVAESNVEDSVNETTGTDGDPTFTEREKVEESGDDDEAKDEDSANESSGNNDDDIPTSQSQEELFESSADDGVNKEGNGDVEPMPSQTISAEEAGANHEVVLNDDNNGEAEGKKNGDEMEHHSGIAAETTDGQPESFLNKSD